MLCGRAKIYTEKVRARARAIRACGKTELAKGIEIETIINNCKRIHRQIDHLLQTTNRQQRQKIRKKATKENKLKTT